MTYGRRLIPILLAIAVPAFAQTRPQAFTGATVLPISREAIANGVLVVKDGRIVALGGAGTAIPPDAERHDVSGKVVMPGLVDTHSHIGNAVGGSDSSAAIQPDVRVLDAIDVRDASVHKARAGGITTANIMHGSGLLLSGQTIYLKLRNGQTIDDLMILDSQGKPAGGIKMANGTNSIKDPPLPGSRSKSAAMIRAQYVKAVEYRDKIRRAKGDPEKMPARDLGLEALVEVLEGKRIVQHHTHRHDDVITVLRIAKEFGYRPVLHHVSDAWKIADEIAAAGAPVSLIMLESPGGKLEARDVSWISAPVLEKAGALVAFHTDDPINDSRLLLRSAALGVRAGMSREKALEALTLSGAKMLGLDARTGSLDKGKDADFIVLSGDPLSVYTKVEQTWVEGAKVFDRSDPKDHLWAVGGWGAGNPGNAEELIRAEEGFD